PLLNGRATFVSSVDFVPDERADDAEAVLHCVLGPQRTVLGPAPTARVRGFAAVLGGRAWRGRSRSRVKGSLGRTNRIGSRLRAEGATGSEAAAENRRRPQAAGRELLHYSRPNSCILNVATAPTTPAVPGSSAGTIRAASTAGLKARRRTSVRSGPNSASPAAVTPPAMTTTSGLMKLRSVATPAPR